MDITKFNWKITGSLKTQITDKELWKIISSPSNLELFHPFCKKNSIVKWPGKNSIDQIHYYNGLIYERKFINWIELDEPLAVSIDGQNGKGEIIKPRKSLKEKMDEQQASGI